MDYQIGSKLKVNFSGKTEVVYVLQKSDNIFDTGSKGFVAYIDCDGYTVDCWAYDFDILEVLCK